MARRTLVVRSSSRSRSSKVVIVFACMSSLSCAHTRPSAGSPTAAATDITIVELPGAALSPADTSDSLVFVTRSVARPEMPIADVAVAVSRRGPEIVGTPRAIGAATNAQGIASIPRSYAGEVEVVARHVGYQQLAFHVALAAHCRQTLELYLGPAPVVLTAFPLPLPSTPPAAEPPGRVVFTTCAPRP